MALACGVAFATPNIAKAEPANMPQNNIADTKYKLFNALRADEATMYYDAAMGAIARCDRPAFADAAADLHRLAERTDSNVKDAENHVLENVFFGLGAADIDIQDYRTLDELEYHLRQAWEDAQPCGQQKRQLMQIAFEMMTGTLRSFGFPGFLGTEDGANNRTLGVVKPDDDEGHFTGGKLELRIPLGRAAQEMPNVFQQAQQEFELMLWDFFFGGLFGHGDVESSQAEFDPNGDTLLLPGVGMGANPAGFSIAAPNGLVRSMHYDADYSQYGFEFGFGRQFRLNNTRTKLRPFFGFGYENFDSRETFSGYLPSVVRGFSYRTNVDNDVFYPFVGLEASTRPGFLEDLIRAPIELNGGLRYAYQFNDAEGSDQLSVQGFVTDTVEISESAGTHNYSVDAGFTLFPDDPFSIGFGVGFENIGNIPEVTRDGVSTSQLSFDNANSFYAKFGARLRF